MKQTLTTTRTTAVMGVFIKTIAKQLFLFLCLHVWWGGQQTFWYLVNIKMVNEFHKWVSVLRKLFSGKYNNDNKSKRFYSTEIACLGINRLIDRKKRLCV